MKFKKRSDDYQVGIKKQQAIKELREDIRVASIKVHRKGLYILTNPITPKITIKNNRRISFYNNYFLCPIGTFEIAIKEFGRDLEMRIKRIPVWEVDDYTQTPHISGDDGDDICWGSIEDELQQASKNKDWFWAVKLCLDLIEDGNYDGDISGWHEVMTGMQIDYAKRNIKDKHLIETLKQRFKRTQRKTYEKACGIETEHIALDTIDTTKYIATEKLMEEN